MSSPLLKEEQQKKSDYVCSRLLSSISEVFEKTKISPSLVSNVDIYTDAVSNFSVVLHQKDGSSAVFSGRIGPNQKLELSKTENNSYASNLDFAYRFSLVSAEDLPTDERTQAAVNFLMDYPLAGRGDGQYIQIKREEIPLINVPYSPQSIQTISGGQEQTGFLYLGDAPVPVTLQEAPPVKKVVMDIGLSSVKKPKYDEVPAIELEPIEKPKTVILKEKSFRMLNVMDESLSVSAYVNLAKDVLAGLGKDFSSVDNCAIKVESMLGGTVVRADNDNLKLYFNELLETLVFSSAPNAKEFKWLMGLQGLPNPTAKEMTKIINLKDGESLSLTINKIQYRVEMKNNELNLHRDSDIRDTAIVIYGDGDPGGAGTIDPDSIDDIVAWAKERGNRVCMFYLEDKAQEAKEYAIVRGIINEWKGLLTGKYVKYWQKQKIMKINISHKGDFGNVNSIGQMTYTKGAVQDEVDIHKKMEANAHARKKTMEDICTRTGGQFIVVSDEELNKIRKLSKNTSKKAALAAEHEKIKDQMLNVLINFVQEREKK